MMARRPGLKPTAIALSLLLVVAACGPATDATTTTTTDADATTTTTDADALDRAAEFHFAISLALRDFDPHLAAVGIANAPWTRAVYDNLLSVGRGPSGALEIGPMLATSYEVAPDGLSVRLELRDDVTFQDGTPFDAAAVKANVERVKGSDGRQAIDFQSIESAEVEDDTHVILRLSEADPTIPWTLALSPGAMMISPSAFDSDLQTMPVGTGPFTLVSLQEGETVFERWDDHWDPDAALVQRLVISTVPDENARFNGVRSGSYDAAQLGPPVDGQSESLLSEGFQRSVTISPGAIGLLMHTGLPPFDDVRVRRAVWLAVNRTEIAEALGSGISGPVFQTFREGQVGYVPELDVEVYDPEEARRLVQEAGAEGATVNFLVSNAPGFPEMGEVVQRAMLDIGLDAQVIPIASAESGPTWLQGGHHGRLANISGEPHPLRTLRVSYLLGANNVGGPSAELVEMVEEASRLPFGSEEEKLAYEEINRFVVENPVHAPIRQDTFTIFTQGNVVGLEGITMTGTPTIQFRGVGIRE